MQNIERKSVCHAYLEAYLPNLVYSEPFLHLIQRIAFEIELPVIIIPVIKHDLVKYRKFKGDLSLI